MATAPGYVVDAWQCSRLSAAECSVFGDTMPGPTDPIRADHRSVSVNVSVIATDGRVLAGKNMMLIAGGEKVLLYF
jgi:hypothetical protein